jgi:ketosteroid isomerase-like protein
MDARAFVAHFEQGWREPRGPDAFLAHFAPLMGPETRMRQPLAPDAVGEAEFAELFRGTFRLSPDLHARVIDSTVEGDVALIEFELIGSVGRRSFRVPACDRIVVREGMVRERRAYFDPLPILAAVLLSPGSWPRAARLLARRRRRGSSRPDPRTESTA